MKKNRSVMVDPDLNTIPIGSFIVCGRFDARSGSAAGRMVGLGLGASRLDAHVTFLSKTESGFTSINSFDVKLKGRNLIPPLSTAVVQATVMEKRQNLLGLGKRLADPIVKRLYSDLKRPQPFSQVGRWARGSVNSFVESRRIRGITIAIRYSYLI